MSDFDWDVENRAHIARHRVTPSEVEEVFNRKRIIQDDPFPEEKRFDVYGRTAAGRYLVVVFMFRGERTRCVRRMADESIHKEKICLATLRKRNCRR